MCAIVCILCVLVLIFAKKQLAAMAPKGDRNSEERAKVVYELFISIMDFHLKNEQKVTRALIITILMMVILVAFPNILAIVSIVFKLTILPTNVKYLFGECYQIDHYLTLLKECLCQQIRLQTFLFMRGSCQLLDIT